MNSGKLVMPKQFEGSFGFRRHFRDQRCSYESYGQLDMYHHVVKIIKKNEDKGVKILDGDLKKERELKM